MDLLNEEAWGSLYQEYIWRNHHMQHLFLYQLSLEQYIALRAIVQQGVSQCFVEPDRQ